MSGEHPFAASFQLPEFAHELSRRALGERAEREGESFTFSLRPPCARLPACRQQRQVQPEGLDPDSRHRRNGCGVFFFKGCLWRLLPYFVRRRCPLYFFEKIFYRRGERPSLPVFGGFPLFFPGTPSIFYPPFPTPIPSPCFPFSSFAAAGRRRAKRPPVPVASGVSHPSAPGVGPSRRRRIPTPPKPFSCVCEGLRRRGPSRALSRTAQPLLSASGPSAGVRPPGDKWGSPPPEGDETG